MVHKKRRKEGPPVGMGAIAVYQDKSRFCCIITPEQVVNVNVIADHSFVFVSYCQGAFEPPWLFFDIHKLDP